jgi:hypothetical protein
MHSAVHNRNMKSTQSAGTKTEVIGIARRILTTLRKPAVVVAVSDFTSYDADRLLRLRCERSDDWNNQLQEQF